MRKLLALCLILIFCSVFASAQTTDKAVDWKYFSGIDEEFSVEVPESFKLDRFLGTEKDAPKFYKDFSNGTYFFITSDKDISSSHYKQIYLLAIDNKAESSDRFIGDTLGKFFSFTDSEGFQQKVFAIQGKNRFYMFHTVSETENNPDVERFFASIKFDKVPLEEKKPLRKQTEPEKTSNQNNGETKSISGIGSGNGNGTGSGGGSGSGIGVGSDSPNPNHAKPTNQTTALRILSKPKPSYTDLARIYGISGKVSLRITFLANGTIGTVTTFTKLPFGLTNNAINAARSMRFEPAMRNGTPYSVAKLVEYNFTLY